jgi:hypothetical protein
MGGMREGRKIVVPPVRKRGRHRHHDDRRRVTAMSIHDIKRTELTPSEREVLEEDRKRWKRMGTGAHLDEWLAYGPGISIRRHLAMKMAYTNRPEGKGYITNYNALLNDDGLDTRDKKLMSSLTSVQWLHEDAERLNILREVRETMTPGERSRLNSPISAKQRVMAVLKAREGGTEENLKTSPVAVLKNKLVEQTRQIAHLEEQLAAAQHDGSLFDLRRDSAGDIADAIAANISEHKARAIAASILGVFKARQKPAG